MPARRWRGAEPPWFQAAENTNGYYVRQTYSKWLRGARQWQRRGRCINPWPALTPYSQEVLKDGPVRYWKLAEASGTVAIDSSGYGRSGTYVSGPFLGQPGPATTDNDTAAGFQRGFDQYATVPWPQLTQITFEAWTYRPSTADDFFDNVVLSDPVGANGAGLVFFQDAITGQVVDGSSVQQFAQDPNTLTPGDWHHIVFTYEGTTMLLYVDGAQVASQAATGLTIGTGTGTIGRYAAWVVTAGTFNGNLAQVAIYNKVLSAARVLVHYNTMAPFRITTRVPTFAVSQRKRTQPQLRKSRTWAFVAEQQGTIPRAAIKRVSTTYYRRSHLWSPVLPQVGTPIGQGQRRTRPPYVVKGKHWYSSWVPPVVLPNPAIILGWGQRRTRPPYVRRGHVWTPIPPQAAINTNGYWLPQGYQRWLRADRQWQKRGRIWAPIPPQEIAYQPYLTFYTGHKVLRAGLLGSLWRRRGRLWLPVLEQQPVAYARPRERTQPPYTRRGHLHEPPWFQAYGPNPPTVIGALRTREWLGPIRWVGPRKAKVWLPTPPQVIIPVSKVPGLYLPDENLVTAYIVDDKLITVYIVDEMLVSVYVPNESQF